MGRFWSGFGYLNNREYDILLVVASTITTSTNMLEKTKGMTGVSNKVVDSTRYRA